MTSLNQLLGLALHLHGVRDWLGPADLEALSTSQITPRCAVLLGRLTRGGDLSAVERRAVAAWLRASPASSWEAVVEQIGKDLERLGAEVPLQAIGPSTLSLRDDVESALCTLGLGVAAEDGHEALAAHERRLLSRAGELDRTASTRLEETPPSFEPGAPSFDAGGWIRRAASLDPGTWWLDAVALLEIRRKLRAFTWSADISPSRSRPLRVRGLGLRGSRAEVADVVGCEDDLSDERKSESVLLARLFDDEVELLALGATEDAVSEPILWLRPRRAGRVELIAVDSEPAGVTASRAGDDGYLISLPGEGERVLVVRARVEGVERTERLDVAVEE